MGNTASATEQESLPLCPKYFKNGDRRKDRKQNKNNNNSGENEGRAADFDGKGGWSGRNANNNAGKRISEEHRSDLNIVRDRKEDYTERINVSDVAKNASGAVRKSILRNATSEADSRLSVDGLAGGASSNMTANQRRTSIGRRMSSKVSDLRMRSIASDPRLSITSYGKNEEDRIVRNTASFPALMHFIRAFICCGFLSLPYAVKLAGLMVGTIVIIATGVITSISVYLLIISAKKLQDRTRMSYLDYGQVFEAACFYGPKPFRGLKKAAKLSINIPMAAAEIGVCSAYILFVAENVQQVTEFYVKKELDIRIYIWCISVLLFPLGMIKSPSSLTYISMTGNVVLLSGLVIIFYNISINLGSVADLPQSGSFSKTLMCICLTLFALEGIGFVLPLEGQMENPEDMMGWNGVLVTGSVFITLLYAALGFFGFLAYGMHVKATVTLNLPQQPLYQALKIIIAIMVLLTYTIQFYIAVDIIYWGWLAQYTEDREKRRKYEVLFRFCGVLLTACLASVVPHLAEFMSLIGALAGFPLAVIIPCIVDFLVRWPEKALGSLGFCFWRVILDFVIIVFGIAAMFAGTVVSVFEIIDAFKMAP